MDEIKLFIFDMDGLMFDTGRLAYGSAYLQSAKEYNYEMTHNVYYYLTGRTEAGIIEAMKELYGNDMDISLWRKAMNKYKNAKLEQTNRVYKKVGLVELLKFAKKNQVKVAVASSTARVKVEYYLEIENIKQYIDYIIAGDEVKQGKPNPEIFLTACEKALVATKNAVVLEDSLVGIKAAKNAGIRAFLIEDDLTDLPIYEGKHRLKKDLSKIHQERVIPDYEFNTLLEVKEYLEQKTYI